MLTKPVSGHFPTVSGEKLSSSDMSALGLNHQLRASCHMAWQVVHKLMAVTFEEERDRRLEASCIAVDNASLTGGIRGVKTALLPPQLVAITDKLLKNCF